MRTAVISGDIIAFTSLSDKGRALVEEKLKRLLEVLNREYKVYSRLIKGDYLECVIPEPESALRVALIIKTYLKSLSANGLVSEKDKKRLKFFKTYSIRLAIGYGELSRYDPEKGIIDGEAIYLSGRRINEEATHKKERIVIKNTLFFVSNSENLNKEFEPLLTLIDFLLSKATAKQCEVLYMKLMNYNEEAIAAKIKKTQPVVNHHSMSAGWNSIEKAVIRFSDVLKTIK
jgi:hypothetical protein